MAVNPGSYSFVLQRGADWSVLLQFKDSNNDAIDLTGATVAAQAWNQPGTKKYADFGVAYTNRSNGPNNHQPYQRTNGHLSRQGLLRRACNKRRRYKRILFRRRY